jgi:hypothetical protein
MHLRSTIKALLTTAALAMVSTSIAMETPDRDPRIANPHGASELSIPLLPDHLIHRDYEIPPDESYARVGEEAHSSDGYDQELQVVRQDPNGTPIQEVPLKHGTEVADVQPVSRPAPTVELEPIYRDPSNTDLPTGQWINPGGIAQWVIRTQYGTRMPGAIQILGDGGGNIRVEMLLRQHQPEGRWRDCCYDHGTMWFALVLIVMFTSGLIYEGSRR